MPWRQTPSRKKKAIVFTTVTTSVSQDQLNTEFSKVCENFKARGIECLKYVREFYSPVYYCGDISTPLNMTWHKTKRDWLLYLSVIWPLGRALAIQSGQSFQTFSRQSEGLATWDYHNPKPTHRIAYTCQSPFLHINTTSFCFYLGYHLYALSWDRVVKKSEMSIKTRARIHKDSKNPLRELLI